MKHSPKHSLNIPFGSISKSQSIPSFPHKFTLHDVQPPTKSKKKSTVINPDIAVYTKNVTVITRKSIDLPPREKSVDSEPQNETEKANETEESNELNDQNEAIPTAPVLKEEHIENIKDLLEVQLDGNQEVGDHNDSVHEPIYVVLHGLCDHIDDIKMIQNNGLQIRSIFHILNLDKTRNPNCVQLTDSTKYDEIECLNDMLIEEVSVHKVVSNRKGIESVVPKEVGDIALDLRASILRMENEWKQFDAKWRQIKVLQIPEIEIQEITQFSKYNETINGMESVKSNKMSDIELVMNAMIEQIASDFDKNEENEKNKENKAEQKPIENGQFQGIQFMDCIQRESAVFLASKCGFRKWMDLPVDIKEAEPNAFYGGTSKTEYPLFLRRRCTPIVVSEESKESEDAENATKWIMGLTEIGDSSNENRFLWLRPSPFQSNNGMLSVVRNGESVILGVEWPGNGRLGMSVLSKSKDADCDRVALSTANGITVEYDRLSGDLTIYYLSDLLTHQKHENEIVAKDEMAENDGPDKVEVDKNEDNDGADGVQVSESEVVWNVDTESKVVYRTIDVEGAITVFYSDSSQRRVFPDSEIWTKTKESKWIEIKVNGDCVVDGAVSESVKIKTAKTTDSDSMTSIITRTDNVMVMEQQNGNRVIQCPDSMDILVESSIDSEEWKGHELSQWIESIGVDRESAEQIANDKLKENAEARKTAQKLVRFQLKNDNMMPTVIVHKVEGQQRTECIFDDQFRAVFARSNPPNESADSALSAVSDRGTVTVEHQRFGTLTFGMAKGRESEALFVPISSTENALEFGIDLKAENPSISWSDSSRIALNGEHSGTILEAPKQSENGGSKPMNSSNEKEDEMEVRPAPRTKVEIPSVLGESMDCGTGTGTANENDSGSVSIDDMVAEDERIGNERRNEIENENENEPETETEAVPALGLRANRESNGNGNGDVAETVTAEENVGYFSNEPFFREFEISCSVAEILAECPPCSGLEKVRTLNALCSRLRALISGKNASDSTVSTLSLDEVEELVTELVPPPESSSDHIDIDITEHLHRLLCSVGLKLDAENGCYVAAKCTILIDGGICFLSSKLDEFHVDFKKRIVAERDAVSEREAVSEMTTMTAAMRMDDERRGAEDITVDTDRHEHHHQDFRAKSISSPPDADLLSRCMSHCSCCPPQSPLRATRMDYLGRTRDHFISIDDLQKYPAPVPQRKLNRKYIESEASVERRVRTSSTFNSTMASQEASIPTVLIQPASFDFGALRIGNVYRFTASITNHGHSQSRFHLSIASQSDPEHPVHIKAYHKMGAIAPGISIALQIELCSESRCGPYSNTLTVKTKKHIFDVDVTAHFVKRSNPEHSESATVQATNKRVVCLGRKC